MPNHPDMFLAAIKQEPYDDLDRGPPSFAFGNAMSDPPDMFLAAIKQEPCDESDAGPSFAFGSTMPDHPDMFLPAIKQELCDDLDRNNVVPVCTATIAGVTVKQEKCDDWQNVISEHSPSISNAVRQERCNDVEITMQVNGAAIVESEDIACMSTLLICNICNEPIFESTIELHNMAAHGEGAITHSCYKCGQTFYHSENLRTHLEFHCKWEKRLRRKAHWRSCNICSKCIYSEAHLKIHQAIFHSRPLGDNPRLYRNACGKKPVLGACNVCLMPFYKLKKLRKHFEMEHFRPFFKERGFSLPKKRHARKKKSRKTKA